MGIRFRALAIAAAAAPALYALSCAPAPAAPRTPTPVPTPNVYASVIDLPADRFGDLTLSVGDLGDVYAKFVLDDTSGMMSVSTRAATACNPVGEASALHEYDWRKGYFRTFISPEETTTVWGIGSAIDVYEEVDGARGKLGYDKRSLREAAEQTTGCQGITLERVEEFGVPELGESAWGLQAHALFAGERGSVTVVSFRRANLIGTIMMWSFGYEDSSTAAIDYARKLDGRITQIANPTLSFGGDPLPRGLRAG